jgi:TonB family protein
MFNLDTVDFQRIATATVGALVLSTACVAAAVVPARAAEAPKSVAAWQKAVNARIDRSLLSQELPNYREGVATIRVRFDDAGQLAATSVARSTGDAKLDAVALRTARSIAYPTLPVQIRNKPVLMKVYFSKPAEMVDGARRAARNRALALDTNTDVQVADAQQRPAA